MGAEGGAAQRQPELSAEQERRAVEVMHEYLNAPPNPDGRTPWEVQTARDEARRQLIAQELKPLLDSYLAGGIDLNSFKSTVDSLNKRHEYWGFKGIKGQMFFNMVVNVADDLGECDQELKAALAEPENEEIARSRLRSFISYVKRLGEQHVEAGGSAHGRPKFRSAPFFVSYFWQIHQPNVWPVYYTNSVNTMVDMNLWQPQDAPPDDYIDFKHIHEHLARLFTQQSERQFDLYHVEHVFWFKGGNPWGESKPVVKETVVRNDDFGTQVVEERERLVRLPDSYVPPIVGILPQMACHDPALEEAAKASGTTLERAFEKSVNAGFTILGYEAKLMGQGKGRVPDGTAVDHDNGYAILWDAKVRGDAYSMGTDDRTIREYILTQSRELKRRRSLRNIYYAIVSSSFREDWDDAVRRLKMETDVSEVCLVEASALVAMVEAKLRDPQQITLGPDGLQRLFCTSGVLSAEDVREVIG